MPEFREETLPRIGRGRRSVAAWGFAFLVIWALIDACSSAASLVVAFHSSVPGTSQVFYRTRQDRFSPTDSVKLPVEAGTNELTFALPHLQDRLRWDPVGGSAVLDVRSIRLTVGWASVAVPLESVRPGFDIGLMSVTADRVLHIETESEARDPQTFLTAPVGKLRFWKQLFAASVSALALAVALICLRLDGLTARAIAVARGALVADRAALRALPYLIAIAVLFHFSSLAAFSLSPDDEYAAFRTNPDVWITQGRFTDYLVERFLLPQPTVPYLPDAIFCLCVSLSYVLLGRAHALATTWRTYALFPLFCAFPTWAFIAEFYANLPSVSFGLVLVSAGALVFQRAFVLPAIEQGPLRFRHMALALGLLSVLVAGAIGAYQSYLFAFVSMGLGIVIVTTLSRPDVGPKQIGRMLASLGVTAGASLGVYALIQKLMLAAAEVHVQYVDEFLKPDLLLQHPAQRVEFLYDELVSVYTGSTSLYGASLASIGVLLVLGSTSMLFSGRLSETQPWWSQALVRAGLLVLSLAALVMPVGLMAAAPDLPLRSLVGVPYAVWLFGVLALTHRLYIPRLFGLLAALTGAFQVAYLLSLYAANTAIAGNHDHMMAESVYQRVATANLSFDRRQPYQVDFFGAKSVNISRYPAVATTTLSRSFFDWDGGNPDRIVTYMTLLGYDNLRTVDRERRRRLIGEFQSMPSWPAGESVKVVDGVTLVKLSDYPDSSHTVPP